jgi:diketogulonate reductase-like aldo/keto reductase
MSVSEVPARTLSNGVKMPILGLGVWQASAGTETEQAVRWALEAGYRHIDTARLYRNEESVGKAVRDSGVPREEIFITTKLQPREADGLKALEESCRLLGTDYVDLYLIHWPTGRADEQWRALEQGYERGLAKAIGVSNWGEDDLAQTFALAEVRPQVNQVESHPFAFPRRLWEHCEAEEVVFEAYSPLSRGRNLRNKTLVAIAERHERTPAQVALRWQVQRDIVVIPKSVREARIAENAQIFDFALSEEEMGEIDALS